MICFSGKADRPITGTQLSDSGQSVHGEFAGRVVDGTVLSSQAICGLLFVSLGMSNRE